MRRLSRRLVLFVFGLSAALVALAQDAPTPTATHPILRHYLRECLSILDLSDRQKADIQAILEAAAPTVQADVAAVRGARQTLEAALDANPPDACVIGVDALALKAARETLRGERDSVRQQVEATLTPDQAARLEGCLAAPFPGAPAADADASSPQSEE